MEKDVHNLRPVITAALGVITAGWGEVSRRRRETPGGQTETPPLLAGVSFRQREMTFWFGDVTARRRKMTVRAAVITASAPVIAGRSGVTTEMKKQVPKTF